jgi:hypothetical protein
MRCIAGTDMLETYIGAILKPYIGLNYLLLTSMPIITIVCQMPP